MGTGLDRLAHDPIPGAGDRRPVVRPPARLRAVSVYDRANRAHRWGSARAGVVRGNRHLDRAGVAPRYARRLDEVTRVRIVATEAVGGSVPRSRLVIGNARAR